MLLLVLLGRCLGQVMMPGSHQDRLVPDEVGHLDAVLLDGDQGSVASVVRRPLRSTDRAGGVAPAAAEASAGARPKRLEGSARERGMRVGGALRLAPRVARRTLERA